MDRLETIADLAKVAILKHHRPDALKAYLAAIIQVAVLTDDYLELNRPGIEDLINYEPNQTKNL